jgi:pre-mRNA-processing factor 19
MLCALSGSVPESPVVSKKSGHLFDRDLIEKCLASEQICPVTGKTLCIEDLIPVQAAQTVRPKPITATSIPGMLSHFQNEWDELMLETYTLKQHLDATRKELSQVLYQHDAACRVIARLTRERDEARSMSQLSQGHYAATSLHTAANLSSSATMELEGGQIGASLLARRGGASGTFVGQGATAAVTVGITQRVLDAVTAKGKELSKLRKKRKPPGNISNLDDIKTFVEVSTASPHAAKEPNGVTCVGLHPRMPSITVSGGMDSNAVIFDHTVGREISVLRGHAKRLHAALFHPDDSRRMILTASADKSVKLWTHRTTDTDYAETLTIGNSSDQKCFGGEVTGIAVHPTGDYAACSSKDGFWSLASLSHGAILESIGGERKSKSQISPCTGICFHPDGLLLGVGRGSPQQVVEIWDVKTQSKIHSFEGHAGAVLGLDFSENGYYMASTGTDGQVKLWDLRKLKDIKTMNLPGRTAGNCVCFDHSGTFLVAGGGSDITVSTVKDWDQIKILKGHSKDVTAVRFGPGARGLVSASLDRTVKLWGVD